MDHIHQEEALTIMCTSSLPLLLSQVFRRWQRMPDLVLSIPSMSLNFVIPKTMLGMLRSH